MTGAGDEYLWSSESDAVRVAHGDSAEAAPTETYAEVRTHIPPVLALEGGELVIKLMHDNVTVTASVGDGRQFFARVVDMLVNPALLKAYKAQAFVREFASPND